MKDDASILAFPNTYVDCSVKGIRNTVVIDGMSLRDWFAGLALQGLLADGPLRSDPNTLRNTTDYAYVLADKMMEARKIK